MKLAGNYNNYYYRLVEANIKILHSVQRAATQ